MDDAFRIDAYLDAGNTRDQLYGPGDHAEAERACRLALAVVDSACSE